MNYQDPLDQEERKPLEFEVIDQQKESWSGLFYIALFVGFVVIAGVRMYQTWPDSNTVEVNTINSQRIELLQSLKNNNQNESKQAEDLAKYDSLSRRIEELME